MRKYVVTYIGGVFAYRENNICYLANDEHEKVFQ